MPTNFHVEEVDIDDAVEAASKVTTLYDSLKFNLSENRYYPPTTEFRSKEYIKYSDDYSYEWALPIYTNYHYNNVEIVGAQKGSVVVPFPYYEDDDYNPLTSNWGDMTLESGHSHNYYIRYYNNQLQLSTNGSTWTSLKTGSSRLCVTICGGGGGGGGANAFGAIIYASNPSPGGGGGATVIVYMDLRVTGNIHIYLGSGGSGGKGESSGAEDVPATDGEDSYIEQVSTGYRIVAGGGRHGSYKGPTIGRGGHATWGNFPATIIASYDGQPGGDVGQPGGSYSDSTVVPGVPQTIHIASSNGRGHGTAANTIFDDAGGGGGGCLLGAASSMTYDPSAGAGVGGRGASSYANIVQAYADDGDPGSGGIAILAY